MSDFRNQLIDRNLKSCRHFNGVQNNSCAAEVCYAQLEPADRTKFALPCLPSLKRNRELAICEKFVVMSQAEAETDADKTMALYAKVSNASSVAHANAKVKGFGRGNGGHSEIPCPAGCGGTLQYSVASYNGHMHARCSTKECVSWME